MPAPSPEELHRALERDVLTSGDPAGRLLRHLEALDRHKDLQTQANLFESLLWQADIGRFWIWHRMRAVYADLGRSDMAFVMAGMAARSDPHSPHLHVPFREMFLHFRDHGQGGPAVDVFLRHAARDPERPIADRWEIDPLARRLGLSLDGDIRPSSPQARRDRLVLPAESWTPRRPARIGSVPLPTEIGKLGATVERAPVTVAELRDAELVLSRNAMVALDSDGNVQVDLSLGPYPKLILDSVLQRADIERIDIPEAVVVLDPHPPPNLGHFLLDHLGRLAFYAAAGLNLSRCWVVGPALTTSYQQAIAARLSIGPWLSADRVARLKVGRLWISTDCRELQHPGHLCAPMVVRFVRTLLDAASQPGTRRLYVSRADTSARRVANEAELRPLLAARGFETIVPGEMAYEDQLAAFREASHVVAPHGAALAHLAACAPGTRVLELFHPLYSTWAYGMLAAACDLDYTAAAGRDAVSAAPELNDLAVAGSTHGRYGDRDMRVDPAILAAWLEAAP